MNKTRKKVISNNLYMLGLLWKACPGKITYSAGCTIIDAIIEVISLYVLRIVVNIAQKDGEFLYVVLLLVSLLVFIVVYNALKATVEVKVLPQMEYKNSMFMSLMLRRKMEKCDIECYESKEYYDKYTRAMLECKERADEVLNSILASINSIIKLVGSSILAFAIDPMVLLISILSISIGKIGKKKNDIEYNMKQSATLYERKKQYASRIFYLKEYAEEIRLTNIAKVIIDKYKDAVEKLKKLYRTQGKRIAKSEVTYNMVSSFGSYYLLLLYAAWKTLVVKSIQYGDCLVLVNAAQRIGESVQTLTSKILAFHSHSLHIGNLKEFMDREPTIYENDRDVVAENGSIEVKNLSFKYNNSNEKVLDNISFKIKQGEKVAIVGENGAGKTTLIKLLLRLYDPDEGIIKLNGKDIKKYRLSSYRNLFATVFQDFVHFPVTIKENILLKKYGVNDRIKVEIALHESGIFSMINELPDGMESVLDKEIDTNGVSFSKGQMQKLALARAYAKDCPILILDEPSSALDPISENEMFEALLKASEGKTVMFISHRLSFATKVDQIIVMEKGKIVEAGTHEELIKNNGQYANLFNVQAKKYEKEDETSE